ncbi:MAG TPA: hypothetical protein VGK93_04410 [Candidatus Eisenbacteria bacterium]
MPTLSPSKGFFLAVLMFLLAAGPLTGCAPDLEPLRPRPSIIPTPDSPGNVLRLLEWSCDNRAVSEYRVLFTEDFYFVFSALDASGNAYRDNPWRREDELTSTTKLFQGGDTNQPAASNISLDLDRNFVVLNDPRPGKLGRWHKMIRTSVALRILAGGDQVDVTGGALFFAVRGDSALIPQELRELGFLSDSNRWYIERWEDETAQPVPPPEGRSLPAQETKGRHRLAAANPTKNMSWGQVKVAYR